MTTGHLYHNHGFVVGHFDNNASSTTVGRGELFEL